MSIFDDIKLKEFKQFFSRNVELLFIHVYGAEHFLKGSLRINDATAVTTSQTLHI